MHGLGLPNAGTVTTLRDSGRLPLKRRSERLDRLTVADQAEDTIDLLIAE
jgi:hypothetical protein